jgi:hypothetical protein
MRNNQTRGNPLVTDPGRVAEVIGDILGRLGSIGFLIFMIGLAIYMVTDAMGISWHRIPALVVEVFGEG